MKEREGEIDGVPAEAVGPRADDGCRGAIAWDGRTRCPEGANRGDEKGDGQERHQGADRRGVRKGEEACRPDEMKHYAEGDRAKVDEWWTDEPQVGDGWLGRFACHAVSPRTPNPQP